MRAADYADPRRSKPKTATGDPPMSAAPGRALSLIGAPTDAGASDRGASMGPEAMRVAGLRRALEARGLDVRDLGNLAGPQHSSGPPVDGYRNLAEVVEWNRLVHEAVHGELGRGRLPLVRRVDHGRRRGRPVPPRRREAGRALRVLWLDAHADFNT